MLPMETAVRRYLLCIYLGLRTLDWDNRDSFLAYVSTMGNNQQRLGTLQVDMNRKNYVDCLPVLLNWLNSGY